MNDKKLQRLEAELYLARGEAEFVQRKLDNKLTREDRIALREARQQFRERHRVPAEDGVTVGTIDTVGSPLQPIPSWWDKVLIALGVER